MIHTKGIEGQEQEKQYVEGKRGLQRVADAVEVRAACEMLCCRCLMVEVVDRYVAE